MNSRLIQRAAGLIAFLVCAGTLGCGAEMIRPRASAEKVGDRPGRALVIGQFDVVFEGFGDDEDAPDMGMTRHRVRVGDDDLLFEDHVPNGGRTFAVWVYPGVFCFGQPTLGLGKPPKLLGKGRPCAEIKEDETAYYVGSVTWHVKKDGSSVKARLEVDDRRESVMGARSFVGIYAETALVSTQIDADKVAAKYKLP